MTATPLTLMAKAIFFWIIVMLPTLLTLVTRDFTINIILLAVAFPIMLAFLTNMNSSPFIVKTSIIGLSSAMTFFVLYAFSKLFPKIQDGLSNPGQNRTTTVTIILLIASVYAISMGISGYFLPMFDTMSASASASPSLNFNNMRRPNAY